MKPLIHSKRSVLKFGGKIEDYIDIHNFFDQTKAFIPDASHRLVLHNAFGIFLCEQQFGEIVVHNGQYKRMPYITNSDGNQVSVRDIAEAHVIEDLGCIPTLQDCWKVVEIPINFVGGIKPTITIKRDQIQMVD